MRFSPLPRRKIHRSSLLFFEGADHVGVFVLRKGEFTKATFIFLFYVRRLNLRVRSAVF